MQIALGAYLTKTGVIKIKYNKLVRDKIPDIIRQNGEYCDFDFLSDEEYRKKLEEKLDEEVAEYHKDKNIGELADILEVLYALAETQGRTPADIEKVRKIKAEERGTFSKKILLKETFKRKEG